MNKQTVAMVFGSLFLLVGLSAGAYFLLETQKNDKPQTSQKKPSVDVSIKESKPATENVESNSNLQVKGEQTQNQTQQKQQLLSPVDFDQYEQFANSETAQYQDSVIGSGVVAENGDTLAVIYKGWLTDGRLFDQSRTNEQNQLEPFIFKLGSGQVIQGWEQTLVGMKEGGKRRLVIPSKDGYGEAGQDPIPPNAMLIFDVELVQVQKP